MNYQYDRAVVPATLYWQLKLGKCEQLADAGIDNFILLCFFIQLYWAPSRQHWQLFLLLFIIQSIGNIFFFFVSLFSFDKCELLANASIDNTKSSVLALA